MPKNTVGEFIKSVFSTLVNKDDEVFKALFANPDGTGVVETIFNDMEETRNAWCNNSNVYNQSGEMLEKSLSFFSVLKRLFRESDDSYKDRNELLFYRNGDTVWGDKWDILKLFKRYFGTELVYIVNNTNEARDNLLLDGDFEAKNAWTLENCVYDPEARFCERNGVLFNSSGSCRQAVTVLPDSTYFLHFFLKGAIGIEIKDDHGRYWNAIKGELGEWQTGPCLNAIPKKQEWDAGSLFFLTDTAVHGVTVKFVGCASHVTYLDYVRLFKKENYSSFTLIVSFGGRYTQETIAMAPGTDDPMKRRDYTGYGHFSDGKQDGDPIGPGSLSHFDDAAINEDIDPVLATGTGDHNPSDVKPANDTFIEGGEPLAPWEEDGDGCDVDYSSMSYIEQSHLFGAEGVRMESVYTELLEIVRPGGIASYIEILTREIEDLDE
jgi:hypothetical protein